MLCDIALKTLERAAEVTRRRLVKSTRPTDPIETEAGIDTLCRAIRNGQRFVLSPLFVETGGRALHHVRAFLRIQRGRVQLVRPHWQGNPRFGVIRHRYIALRAEDEPGSWQGGPLPGPHMIDELTDKSGGEQ